MLNVSSEYSFKTKINSNFVVKLAEMLKKASIYFCLSYELHFSNILKYVTIECIKIN